MIMKRIDVINSKKSVNQLLNEIVSSEHIHKRYNGLNFTFATNDKKTESADYVWNIISVEEVEERKSASGGSALANCRANKID